MTHSHTENIYIHQNFNKNQIKSVLLENATYETRPVPERNKDKGLLYFDTEIGRIIVWNGTEWKIVRYFDDRDMTNIEDVQMQDIWAESGQIPYLTEHEAKGLSGSQDVVKYMSEPSGNRGATGYGLTMSPIPGSWSYYLQEMQSVIFPKVFSNGGASYSEFYRPILRNSENCIININDYNINEYKVGSYIQYRVEFKDGKIMDNGWKVNKANPPKITFYKYIGEKLELDYIKGGVSKFRLDVSTFKCAPPCPTASLPCTIEECDKVRGNLTGTGIVDIKQIRILTVNGQEIYPNKHYTVEESTPIGGTFFLDIDMTTDDGTGWQGEGGLTQSDFIYITRGEEEIL